MPLRQVQHRAAKNEFPSFLARDELVDSPARCRMAAIPQLPSRRADPETRLKAHAALLRVSYSPMVWKLVPASADWLSIMSWLKGPVLSRAIDRTV